MTELNKEFWIKESEGELAVSKLKAEQTRLSRSLTNTCKEFEDFVSIPEVNKNLNIV